MCDNNYENSIYFLSDENNDNSDGLNNFPVFGLFSPDPYMENQNNMISNHFEYISEFGPRSQVIPLEEGNEGDINFNKMDGVNNDEDHYSKEVKTQKAENSNVLLSSTCSNSDKKSKNTITKSSIFKIKNNCPNYWRFDATKKHWKSKISQFAEENLNKLIKLSDLPEQLKIRIHKPNSLSFTANVKIKDNYNFLSYNVKDIFTIGKESEDLQKQNNEAFTKIYNYFNKIGIDNLSESERKVKDFLEMNYEDLIRMFYDSSDFIVFKEDHMTKFFDEGTKKQEGFSLLENYGLIKVFKMLNHKKRRN